MPTPATMTFLRDASQAVSPILLLIIATVAAVVAYAQFQTFKRFELLKMLETPKIRKARRNLYRALVQKTPEANWWDMEAHDELERDASAVCASFDIVGVVARGRTRRFFTKYWAASICWTHEAMQPYLDARRRESPGAYESYDDLYDEAKP